MTTFSLNYCRKRRKESLIKSNFPLLALTSSPTTVLLRTLSAVPFRKASRSWRGLRHCQIKLSAFDLNQWSVPVRAKRAKARSPEGTKYIRPGQPRSSQPQRLHSSLKRLPESCFFDAPKDRRMREIRTRVIAKSQPNRRHLLNERSKLRDPRIDVVL